MWSHILPFSSPISVRDIRQQKCINRVMSIVDRNILGLSSQERVNIKKFAKIFNFVCYDTFVYETDSVFMTLFLQNTQKDEYIIIYT
jgi:hypothetical protein